MTQEFISLSLCALLFLTPTAARTTDASPASNQKPEWTDVQLQGPPTRYTVDVEHYRFNGTCDVGNPSFHPIPQDTVTRETCLRCLEAQNPAEIARNPNRGMDGHRVFMPVLVKCVQTGAAAPNDRFNYRATRPGE